MLIKLDLAKRIVKEACFAAIYAASKDNPISLESPSVEDEIDIDVDIDIDNTERAAIDFTEFVSSTLSKAIASLGTTETKTTTGTGTPTAVPQKCNKRSRTRKRPLQIQSKVEGLEHADSLHTMCSLFPVSMTSVESQGNISSGTSPHGVAVSENSTEDDDFDLTMDRGDDEPPKQQQHYSSLSELVSNTSATTTISDSDYDSLLPPVGATSAATTPTRPLRRIKPFTDEDSAAIQQTQTQTEQQQIPRTMTRALTPPASVPTPPRPSDSQSYERFEQKKNIDNVHIEDDEEDDDDDDVDDDDDDDDDDCNYDRPLIGVVSDEGSELVNHQSCNGYYGHNNGRDTDAVIHLAKVGSVIVRKALPLDNAYG